MTFGSSLRAETLKSQRDCTSERFLDELSTNGAPCLALIGCDGAGKSTLAADLTKRLNRLVPTRSVYLGLGTGDLGRRIGQLPILGSIAERFLTGKAKKAHDGAGKDLPGFATAAAMFGFSLLRLRRFRKMLAYRELFRRRGVAGDLWERPVDLRRLRANGPDQLHRRERSRL